jgi:hypothetical protein
MTPLNAFALGGGAALSIWFRSVVGLAVGFQHGFKVVALHSSLLLFLSHKESRAIFKLIFSYCLGVAHFLILKALKILIFSF